MWSNVDQAGQPNSMMIHQGLPPKTGTKYAVNVFFNSQPQRQKFMQAKALEAIVNRSDELHLVDADTFEGAGQPGSVNTYMIFEEPKLYVIPQLLSPDEAQALLHFIYPAETPPSQEVMDGIFARVEAIMGAPSSGLKVSAVSFKSDMNAERLGDVDANAVNEKRLVVFLNEDFERGELIFPGLEARVRPRLGLGVLWSTHTESGIEDTRLEAINAPPAAYSNGTIADRCVVTFIFSQVGEVALGADEIVDAAAPSLESE